MAGTTPTAALSRAGAEPVFYYGSRRWYRGDFPALHDPSTLPGTAILEENFATIRDEVLSCFEATPDAFTANFTPYAYRESGWQTINLISYFLEYESNCRKLPKTMEILRRIPRLSLAQVSVLAPHTDIKAHLGDTNAVIRSHMGISVPASLPEVGMRIDRTDVAWEEGRVWAFCDARRHRAWNRTDAPRIVLVVDVFRAEYAPRRFAIAGHTLATIAMKAVATRYPATRRVPEALLPVLRAPIAAGFRMLLFGQRVLGLPVGRWLGRG